jgi:hypothetical protein
MWMMVLSMEGAPLQIILRNGRIILHNEAYMTGGIILRSKEVKGGEFRIQML